MAGATDNRVAGKSDDDGRGTAWWVIVLVVIVLMLAGAVSYGYARRRKARHKPQATFMGDVYVEVERRGTMTDMTDVSQLMNKMGETEAEADPRCSTAVGNAAFLSAGTADEGELYDTVQLQKAEDAYGYYVKPGAQIAPVVAAIYSEFSGPVTGSDIYLKGIVSAQSKIMKRLKIDTKTIKLGELLGSGMFGQVYSGSLVGDGTKVAVKTIKPGLPNTEIANAELATEAALTASFEHPHIVRVLGIFKDASGLWNLALEHCANGALDTLLQQARELGQSAADFGPRLLVSYAAGIASAMQYLSSLGFVHRDLAARNALVDSNQQARLADFGLSRRVDDVNGENAYMSVTTRPLPMRWMAPEAIELKRYNTETDVWAYGVLVWEIMSLASRPYPNISNVELYRALVVDGTRLPLPAHCPAGLYGVLLSCWELDPQRRPPFHKIHRLLQAVRTPAPKCSYVSKAKGRIGKSCKQLAIGGGGAMLCKAHNCPFPGCHNGKASSAEHCDVHASSSLDPSNGLYGFAVSAPPHNMYDEAAPNDAAAEFRDERFDGCSPGDPEPAPTYGMNMSAGSAPAPAAYDMNPGQDAPGHDIPDDMLLHTASSAVQAQNIVTMPMGNCTRYAVPMEEHADGYMSVGGSED